jgi:outer membrane receptor protein involved in Fe transport
MLDYDKTSRAFLPKVSAAYDVTPDVRIGALVQRAYNPGGVTLDPAHHAQLDFKPEYMWDYELFTRSTVFDGKVSVNANLFYNDIRDAQRELDFDLSSPAGQVGLLQIISEPRARAHGAELEIGLRPAHDLTLKGAIGLLDTRITKGIAKNDPFHDRQFFGAPHFTGSLAADWEPVRNLHLSTQVHHQSGFSGDDAEDPGLRTPGWTMVDARVGWQSGRLTIFGYAQNLFDKFAVIGFSGPRDDPDVEVGVTDPRELGVGMEARF